MRTLTYYVAATLDGFIAGPEGGDPSGEDYMAVTPDLVEFIATHYPETLPGPARDAMGLTEPGQVFDTVVEGRRSYDIGLAAGIDDAYPHLRHLVVSTTLGEAPAAAVEVVAGDPLARVRAEYPDALFLGEVIHGDYAQIAHDGTLDAVGMDGLVAAADLVVTGEGRLDWQSLQGKVVAGVAELAQRHATPAIAVAGQVLIGRRESMALGLSGTYAVAEREEDVERAMADPVGTLRSRTERIAATWSPRR